MFSRLLHDRIRALGVIACLVVLGCGNEPLGIERRDGASGFGAGPGEARWPVDPLRIAVHEFVDIARDVRKAPSLAAALGYAFAPPGWSHDGSSLTADQLRRDQAAAGA